MKRSLIPLLLAAILFSVNTKAQTNANCNAEFTFSVSGFFVAFQAAENTDSASITHYWNFGDGNTGIASQFVTNTYTAPGTYVVTQIVKRVTPNGIVCEKSVTKNIVIQPASTPCELGAGFNFKRDSVQTNKVYFTNTTPPSSVITKYLWSFGDGTVSDAVNPTHIFDSSGLYTVCLKVKRGDNCYDDTCSYVQVQVPGTNSCNLKAEFTVIKDSLTATPLKTYKFINTSVGEYDSTIWNFGDGSPLVINENNPLHVYTTPGTYTVCLIIKQKANSTATTPCASYLCKTIVVGELPSPCNINIAFSWKADSTNKRQTQFFNQTQTTITTARALWNFGDGKQSDSWSPMHLYEKGGVYVVCLRIKQNDTCVKELCQTIIVDSIPEPCNLKARFEFKRDSAQPNKVYFYNVSSFAPNDVVKWSFGDGTYSYDNNPVHVYTAAGLYKVCLYVTRTNACADDTCSNIQVNGPVPCNLVVKFAAHIDSFNLRKIHFYNLSGTISSTDSIRWTFGDGSVSDDLNPVHTYNVPGVYTVCLRIARFNESGIVPCVKEYCQTITVIDSCRLKSDFIFWKDSVSGIALNTYRFKYISEPVTDADSLFWDFGDGSPVVINDNDPVHVYPNPGTYIVCLTVKKGSTIADLVYCDVKQICKTIVVVNPPPPCNLQVAFGWKIDPAQPRKIYLTNLTQSVSSSTLSEWSFGDGTSEKSWNADHVYEYSGTYVVCLKIKQSNTCLQELCKEIKIDSVIYDSCRLQVGFTHTTSAINNRTVIFTNTTITTSSSAQAEWSFGDGTSANTWNAEHWYAQPGKYVVCLKVKTGTDCIRYTCDTVEVKGVVTNCDALFAKFEARRDSYMSNKIYFTAVTNIPQPNQVWLITKLFSLDSTVVLHQNNPAYVFEDTGYYSVCLVIPADNGCIKTYCHQVQIATTSLPTQCVLQSYPNPAQTDVKINLQLEEPGIIKTSVFDLQNVLEMEKSQQGTSGNNTVQINVQGLVPGFYTVRLIYGNHVCYSRFQKL